MKQALLRSSAVVAIAASGFLLPLSAFALTTQQSINAALLTSRAVAPSLIAGDVKVSISERFVNRTPPVNGSFRLSFVQRAISNILGQEQGEGRLTVDEFSVTQETGLESTILDEPIALQWKQFGPTGYLRIEKLPQKIVEGMQMVGVDASPLVGRWIKLDRNELAKHLGPLASERTAAMIATSTNPFSALTLGKTPILLLSRIEKKTVDASGHTIIRARVRLNPYVITLLQRKEVASIAWNDPTRRTQVSEIATRYAKVRRLFAATQFVVEVDQTNGTLNRIEIGGKYTEPKKTCTWSTAYRRNVCPITSYQTYQFLGGVSFLSDSGASVEIPSDAMSLEELIALFEQQSSASAEETTPATLSP